MTLSIQIVSRKDFRMVGKRPNDGSPGAKHFQLPMKSFSRIASLLCLLDRDGRLPPTDAICGACADTHHQSLFSTDSLTEANEKRQCLGTTGKIWLCPHCTLSHTQVNATHDWSFKPHPRPYGFCDKCTIDVDIGMYSTNIRFPFFVFLQDGKSQNELAAAALGSLELQMCPHFQLNEVKLPKIELRRCKLVHSQTWRCPTCNTLPRFHIQELFCGKRTLWVTIFRSYPTSKVYSDEWRSQIVQPEVFKQMAQRWYLTSEIVKGIMNQSRICPHVPKGVCFYSQPIGDGTQRMARMEWRRQENIKNSRTGISTLRTRTCREKNLIKSEHFTKDPISMQRSKDNAAVIRMRSCLK